MKMKCIKEHFGGTRPGYYTAGDTLYDIPQHGYDPAFWMPAHSRHPDGYCRDQPAPVQGGAVYCLGTGPSLMTWLESGAETHGADVACINRAGLAYPGKVQWWLSLHGRFFARWRRDRQRLGRDVEGIKYCSVEALYNPPNAMLVRDVWQYGGGSALYAVPLLDSLGYDVINLVGIDCTGWYARNLESWRRYKPRARITSISPAVLEALR